MPENWCFLALFRPKWTKFKLFFGRDDIFQELFKKYSTWMLSIDLLTYSLENS